MTLQVEDTGEGIDQGNPKDERSFFQRYKGIIIGAVAIVAIIIIAFIIQNQSPSGATENPDLSTLESRIAAEETKSVTQAGDIAGILADIDDIQGQLDDIPVPADYSGAIAQLNNALDALELAVLNITPESVTILGIDEGIGYDCINMSFSKAGAYPVILSLYGANLNTPAAWYPYPANFTIAGIWGGNATLTMAVEPSISWAKGDIIGIKVNGEVDYASVSKGGS